MIYLSRPFSYNDENFTVIGTLLIVHVAFNGELKQNDKVCKVPPGIVERLKFSSFLGSYNRSPYSSRHVELFVEDYSLHIRTSGRYNNGEFFAIVDLKDI